MKQTKILNKPLSLPFPKKNRTRISFSKSILCKCFTFVVDDSPVDIINTTKTRANAIFIFNQSVWQMALNAVGFHIYKNTFIRNSCWLMHIRYLSANDGVSRHMKYYPGKFRKQVIELLQLMQYVYGQNV